jgi:hypothetical protein
MFRFSQQDFWGFKSSGMAYCPLGLVVPDILRDHKAFVDCLTLKGEGTVRASCNLEREDTLIL